MKRSILCFAFFFLYSGVLLASDNKCYLVVERAANYNTQVIQNFAIPLISQYFEKVDPIPNSGISMKACQYVLSVSESRDQLSVTISGNRLNAYGNSKEPGISGVQQSLLRAIYRADIQKKDYICKAYGTIIKEDCGLKKVVSEQAISPIKKSNVEEEFWNEIRNSKNLQDFEDYLNAYPNGYYVNLAKLKIRKFQKIKAEGAPSQAQKSRKNMVLIPAGEFQMGSNSGDKNEKPVHNVYLDAFSIDKYEVTVAQYKQCVVAGKCEEANKSTWHADYCNYVRSSREKHPINCVNFAAAISYCEYAWKRLPTEAEWEKAATWKSNEKYKFPSGSSNISCSNAIMLESGKWHVDGGCGKADTWEVGSKSIEINGTFDMAGNVSEWVSDWFGIYSNNYQKNPTGPSSGSQRVRRGGTWHEDSSHLRGTYRSPTSPTWSNSIHGFRCARSVK